MKRLRLKKGGQYLAAIAAGLFCAHTALYAGGSNNLALADFLAGTRENLEINGSSMTLVKRWEFGGVAPMAKRWQLGFAFDELRGQALVFGGQAEDGGALGDTWLWDAGGWTQKNPQGPPAARYGHGLVWMGGKFLLFGGSAGNDTWTYDIALDTWTRISTVLSPPPVNQPALAYDSDRGEVVMFGGSESAATWIYDVGAGAWADISPVPSPPHRLGASMAYDKVQKKIILFGGKDWDGTLSNDTWIFDPATRAWLNAAPSASPHPHWQGAMAYDSSNGRVFQYGGFTTGYTSELWFYNFSANKWSQHYEYSADIPAGRAGHGLVYDTQAKKARIFGGNNSTIVNAMWTYTFRSTGAWTSAPLDAWAGPASTGPLTWEVISAQFADRPADTGVLFQLASSADGTEYGVFSGPDGTGGTFYTDDASQAIWPGHHNRRFMKIKANFFSGDPPGRPAVSLFNIAYNRAPYVPAPAAPENAGRTNDSTPLFQWSIVSDADGDMPIRYQIQVDSSPDFASPDISEENILSGASWVSFSTGTILPEGVWHWRVRARDSGGLYGYWSDSYSLTVDTTTPPGAVSVMSAARGPAINSAVLVWKFPGDDKGAVNGGTYRVRFSSWQGEILTEEAWEAAAEISGLFSAAPLANVQSVVTGLEAGATYYFAVKTQDELGNLSPLSTVSPFMLVDSSPTITLISPNGGGLLVGTTVISWYQADANPGDTLTKRILISSDSGAHYSMEIASAIAAGVTSYLWNSANVQNGVAYRIKVEVSDQRGLCSSDASDSNFAADNVNQPPAVSFISVPSAGEEAYSGSLAVAWAVSDANSMDTHTYDLFLSADSGVSFVLYAGGLTQTAYTLDTGALANLSTYRIKVVAADSGTPQLTGTVISPVFSVINSLPPGAFNLIKPFTDTFPGIFDLSFAWEHAVDPEGGPVTYTLQYSTTPGPAGGVTVAGLAVPGYTPPLNSLLADTRYYWRVAAQDQYAKIMHSAQADFLISRTKAKSTDGLLLVEILSGLPEQGYLSFQDARAARAGLIEQADRNSKADRLVKTLAYPAWEVQVRATDGSVMSGAGIAARVTFTLPAAAGPAALDSALADIRHLKISRLDENLASWIIPSPQSVAAEQQQVSANVSGVSIFTVIAAITPSQIMSGITNFPNPFQAGVETTRIRYTLTLDSAVKIRIYTLLGDLVRVLGCSAAAAGCGRGDASGLTNEIVWDGKNGAGATVASGMYLAEISAQSSAGTKKEIRRIGVLR